MNQIPLIVQFARAENAPALLDLQRAAFQQEAELYQDWSIPPLQETLAQLEADMAQQVFLVAINHLDQAIVGSVRLRLDGTTAFIGRLAVHPRFQRQGVGGVLMCSAERHFLEARRFELFTGDRSIGNLAFYGRCGYKPFRRQRISDKVTLVYLEKFKDIELVGGGK